MQDPDKGGGSLEYNINVLQRALEQDNDGNNALTQEARDYIAKALIDSGYKVNMPGEIVTPAMKAGDLFVVISIPLILGRFLLRSSFVSELKRNPIEPL